MIDQDEKILLGNSIPLPEVDISDEDDLDNSEEALRGYWFATILNRIGNDDFKYNYLAVISDIKNESPIEEQKRFCYTILEKIEEVYNFEFPMLLEFDNISQIYNLYEFLEFISYDYDKFILKIWKYIEYNKFPKDLKKFCKDNLKDIINQIDEQATLGVYSNLISIFLKSYNKEDMIKWFYESTKEVQSQIMINKLKEKKNE